MLFIRTVINCNTETWTACCECGEQLLSHLLVERKVDDWVDHVRERIGNAARVNDDGRTESSKMHLFITHTHLPLCPTAASTSAYENR